MPHLDNVKKIKYILYENIPLKYIYREEFRFGCGKMVLVWLYTLSIKIMYFKYINHTP